MQTKLLILKKSLIAILLLTVFSCKKDYNHANQTSTIQKVNADIKANTDKSNQGENAPKFDLEVNLYGEGNLTGHIHFRQDPDPAKIITLDTKILHLLPNHEYKLQRAVDAINVVDGDCTSTSWLTLGHGLTPQSIFTDDKGDGQEVLWRDVSAVPSGSSFDIHFRVIDAVSSDVVLTSDCYQYMVR